MTERITSITVFLDGSEVGRAVGRAAAQLAGRFQCHLVGVHGAPRPEVGAAAFARGDAAIQEAITQLRTQEEQVLVEAGRSLHDVARQFNINAELRLLWNDPVRDETLFHSLHTDLVVSTVSGHGMPHGWSPERIVLDASVPVLLIPDDWEGGEIGTKVLLTWNGSREARRAITDALPFLAQPGQTVILTLDADKRPHEHGEEPGSDMARHLARHGVAVEVMQASTDGGDVAEAITAIAKSLGSDLIVLGAYSHSRRMEMLFGGVTRSLLRSSIPVFVSR